MISVDAAGEVAIVRLHAPKANAMNLAFLDGLDRAIGELGDARAAVITGQGKVFSAGLALPELIELDRAALGAFMDRFDQVMLRVLASPAPLVAAINGHAIAGGCVLALMCDQRVMSAGAIGLTEARIGIGLPAVVIEGLRLRVPRTSVAEIALGGALYEPPAALRLGLIDEIGDETRAVERASVLGTAPRIARTQIKAAIVRPALEAIARTRVEIREQWLDSWFSDAAQALLREQVAKLSRK